MPIESGAVIRDRYQIECLHKLGRHGAVYRAFDPILDAQVAIKENLIADPAYQRHFEIEAAILASVHHPNIPRVLDFPSDDDGSYIVMDFIEGENLAEWVAHESLPADKIVQMLEGVFQALAYLHSRRPPIIHRDVEPSNVILAPSGSTILVDFGFAKMFDQNQPMPRTDQRSDQYSLAATIYTLLTHHVPVDSLERAVGREAYRPASSLIPDIPGHIDTALAHAMATRAEDRYADVETFWRALMGGT
jgi:serine/threonine protein kinase